MTVVEVFSDGRSGEFHHRDWPLDSEPRVWWFQPARPALVLGSTQKVELVDTDACARREIEIVQRRSGGGVVLLQPGNTVWIDVLLPAHHPQWRVDIGESALWIGKVGATALGELGCGPLWVHSGAMERTEWSSLVCFAGRGAGEVFDSHGSKVVGISQRRTRHWARFQCVVSLTWDPETLVSVLRPPRPTIEEIASAGSSLTVDAERAGSEIVSALVSTLDTADRDETALS